MPNQLPAKRPNTDQMHQFSLLQHHSKQDSQTHIGYFTDPRLQILRTKYPIYAQISRQNVDAKPSGDSLPRTADSAQNAPAVAAATNSHLPALTGSTKSASISLRAIPPWAQGCHSRTREAGTLQLNRLLSNMPCLASSKRNPTTKLGTSAALKTHIRIQNHAQHSSGSE